MLVGYSNFVKGTKSTTHKNTSPGPASCLGLGDPHTADSGAPDSRKGPWTEHWKGGGGTAEPRVQKGPIGSGGEADEHRPEAGPEGAGVSKISVNNAQGSGNSGGVSPPGAPPRKLAFIWGFDTASD